jgi:hypothetical protein
MNRNRVASLAAAFVTTFSALANAAPADAPFEQPVPSNQDKPASDARSIAEPTSLRVDPALLLPLGPMANAENAGVGGFVGFEHVTYDWLSLGIRGGYVRTLSRGSTVSDGMGDSASGSTGTSYFLVLPGAKFRLPGSQNDGLYVNVEGGLVAASAWSNASVSVTGMNAQTSSSSGSMFFGGGVGAGYDLGAFSFGAELFTADLAHAGDTAHLLATASYRFLSF